MKKIRVTAMVYDRTTREYVRKYVTHTISDELAAMIKKELYDSDGSAFSTGGHGCGDNPGARIQCLSTPLASQKRYWIEPQFHVIDEDDNVLAGWRGL